MAHERTPVPATQRARPPKGFEAQSRKGSQGSRGRLKAAATVKSFSSTAHPNSLWHERAVKKIKPGHNGPNLSLQRGRSGGLASKDLPERVVKAADGCLCGISLVRSVALSQQISHRLQDDLQLELFEYAHPILPALLSFSFQQLLCRQTTLDRLDILHKQLPCQSLFLYKEAILSAIAVTPNDRSL